MFIHTIEDYAAVKKDCITSIGKSMILLLNEIM